MAIDPRKLKPSELCRLLNSTPLGEVINERQLYRHRTRAGFRIGDGRRIDLLRYVAWLIQVRHEPKPERDAGGYEAMKEQARARNAALSQSGRDIGDFPPVADPDRKAKAATCFRFFCESYFPQTFYLPWSEDHLPVIQKIEQAVRHGGLFAMAMPRGSGKSTQAESACIWAVLYGHREFVCLIGSDEGHAMDMLDSIKMELDSNDLLLADFPEVCYPIQSLEGIANRCAGQLYRGERTHISWTAKEIILPTIPDSPASGAIIKVAGITGRIRGMKTKTPDGRSVRPSLVVLDDPQTDESARSLSQCANRESILAGAVLGLAGPGKKISGIMPCTVIRPGDMADNILDRDKHPEWNGERTKLLYAFPKNESLWAQYAQIRAEGLRAGDGGRAATEFYRENQEAMDEGAVVAWPQRFNHDELSAIQHAMNLKLQDEAAFFAEYQNEPLPEETIGDDLLSADQIAGKVNGIPRREIPIGCDQLTMFIDVQQNLLFYVIAGWESDFTGYVVDYGAYPDQQRAYFTLRDARRTLSHAAPQYRIGRSDLCGFGSPDEQTTGPRMETGRRRHDADRTLPGRCQLGFVHRSGLSILPAEPACGCVAAVPRPVRRGFNASLFGIQTPAGRPRRVELADPQRPRQASRPPCAVRCQLLEEFHSGPIRRGDGRSRLPVAVWNQARTASVVRGTPDGGIPGEDGRPRPNCGRMEDSPGTARQPLAGLSGGLRRGGFDSGGSTIRDRYQTDYQKATHEVVVNPKIGHIAFKMESGIAPNRPYPG